MPISQKPRRRVKIFGLAQGTPLDRNAKTRIKAYAEAWSARARQPGQHKGPLTRAFKEVLDALLWSFHNSKDGRCFPSYQTIAAKAGCARSTVAAALKVLELSGTLSWVHRIVRIRMPERDANGRVLWRVRIIRTSNAYTFRDPQNGRNPAISTKSENPSETINQDSSLFIPVAKVDTESPLERALLSLGTLVRSKEKTQTV